jgi:transglutaminase-like putative cysteine protease
MARCLARMNQSFQAMWRGSNQSTNPSIEAYLQASEVIDWQDPIILEVAQEISFKKTTEEAIAKACFEWVRDRIHHSVDYQMNPVTCRASDVLKYKTGYCFAKSHLLAALLRANQIPAGFCYQRLSIDDQGAPYCLHGFNAVHLPKFGWYRIDARGDRQGVRSQFTPPQEQLAYQVRLPEEADFQSILTEPLLAVVDVLNSYQTWDEVLRHLPDLPQKSWKKNGLVPMELT